MSKFSNTELSKSKIVSAKKVYYNNVYSHFEIILKYNRMNYKFDAYISDRSIFMDLMFWIDENIKDVVEIRENTQKSKKTTYGFDNKSVILISESGSGSGSGSEGGEGSGSGMGE